MGRPKGGTNLSHSKEEKLVLVKRNLDGETSASLARETGLSDSIISAWNDTFRYCADFSCDIPLDIRRLFIFFSKINIHNISPFLCVDL